MVREVADDLAERSYRLRRRAQAAVEAVAEADRHRAVDLEDRTDGRAASSRVVRLATIRAQLVLSKSSARQWHAAIVGFVVVRRSPPPRPR